LRRFSISARTANIGSSFMLNMMMRARIAICARIRRANFKTLTTGRAGLISRTQISGVFGDKLHARPLSGVGRFQE